MWTVTFNRRFALSPIIIFTMPLAAVLAHVSTMPSTALTFAVKYNTTKRGFHGFYIFILGTLYLTLGNAWMSFYSASKISWCSKQDFISKCVFSFIHSLTHWLIHSKNIYWIFTLYQELCWGYVYHLMEFNLLLLPGYGHTNSDGFSWYSHTFSFFAFDIFITLRDDPGEDW